MLDALGLVWGQVAIVVAIAALCAGLLGWLIGSRRSHTTSRTTPTAPTAATPATATPAPDHSATSEPTRPEVGSHLAPQAGWTPVVASAATVPAAAPAAERLSVPVEPDAEPEPVEPDAQPEPVEPLGEPTVAWAPFTHASAQGDSEPEETIVLTHSAWEEAASAFAAPAEEEAAAPPPAPPSAHDELLRETDGGLRPVPGYLSDAPETWFAEEEIVLAPSVAPAELEDALTLEEASAWDAREVSEDATASVSEEPARPAGGSLRDNSDPEAWFVEHPLPVPAAPPVPGVEEAAHAEEDPVLTPPASTPDEVSDAQEEASSSDAEDADPGVDEGASVENDEGASPESDEGARLEGEEGSSPEGDDPEEHEGGSPENEDGGSSHGGADAAVPVVAVAGAGLIGAALQEPDAVPTEPERQSREAAEQEVADLRRQLLAMERELARLEGGAVSAWDATVPHLEQRIEQLQHDNAELQSSLRHALDDLQASATEVGSLRHTLSEQRTLLDNGDRP